MSSHVKLTFDLPFPATKKQHILYGTYREMYFDHDPPVSLPDFEWCITVYWRVGHILTTIHQCNCLILIGVDTDFDNDLSYIRFGQSIIHTKNMLTNHILP